MQSVWVLSFHSPELSYIDSVWSTEEKAGNALRFAAEAVLYEHNTVLGGVIDLEDLHFEHECCFRYGEDTYEISKAFVDYDPSEWVS